LKIQMLTAARSIQRFGMRRVMAVGVLPFRQLSSFPVTVLKSAKRSPLLHLEHFTPGSDPVIFDAVKTIVQECANGKESKVLEYARKLDNWPENKDTVLVSEEEIQQQTADDRVSPSVKADIREQLARVTDFANHQLRHSGTDFQVTEAVGDGGSVTYGQKVLPVNSVGCYVPGGRYSHVSSAIMTIATAKVAGVRNIVACSPPVRGTAAVQAATLYAMSQAGADHILCCGGAHGVAAMAYGLFLPHQQQGSHFQGGGGTRQFTVLPAFDPSASDRGVDVLVGPGNSFVAEAKRLLFGKCGIDMFAGPTETLILADETSDPWLVAVDLISQAEHGPTSPAWCITTSKEVGLAIKGHCDQLGAELGADCAKLGLADNVAAEAWTDCGEILLVDSVSDMVQLANYYAPEHLQVMSTDPQVLQYCKDYLSSYGSLFLGEETCVSYGDKCSGPNHVLPTLRAANYSGGLSVDKFLKKLTFQSCDKQATLSVGALASRISRTEGMEGHARSGDARVKKYFAPAIADKVDLGHDRIADCTR